MTNRLRHLLIFIPIATLLISACASQATELPQAALQEQPVIRSSVQVSTFTPTPAPQTTPQEHRVYVVVVPFPTVTDGITSDELNRAWTQGTVPAPFRGRALYMDEPTLEAMTSLWDEPAPELVRTLPP